MPSARVIRSDSRSGGPGLSSLGRKTMQAIHDFAESGLYAGEGKEFADMVRSLVAFIPTEKVPDPVYDALHLLHHTQRKSVEAVASDIQTHGLRGLLLGSNWIRDLAQWVKDPRKKNVCFLSPQDLAQIMSSPEEKTLIIVFHREQKGSNHAWEVKKYVGYTRYHLAIPLKPMSAGATQAKPRKK